MRLLFIYTCLFFSLVVSVLLAGGDYLRGEDSAAPLFITIIKQDPLCGISTYIIR